MAIQKDLNVSSSDLANKVRVHSRTFRDWRRERYTIPFKSLKKICLLSKRKLPKNITKVNRYWYTLKGGRLGGLATFKKYGYAMGNPEKRAKNWRKWWESSGKLRSHLFFLRKTVKRPKQSVRLAEFIGIMMGDGGISERQIVVSLNPKTDGEYMGFVRNLITELFGVRPGVYVRKKVSVASISVSRTDLVEYCHSLGLPIGHKLKQHLDIPKWILRKDGFTRACMRGLMDTDGCIFNECHRINTRLYCYPRMSFVSYSAPLRKSVYALLKKYGLQPSVHNEKAVTLEKREDIVSYFQHIGTSNDKHARRFREFTGGVG